jgi:hypothetical protein
MRRVARYLPLLVLVAAVSCGIGRATPTSGGVFFPTHRSGDMPGALLEGTLVRTGACLFAEAGGARYVVLWPNGYSFDDPNVLDGGGNVVATLGERFTGGGGLVEEVVAEDLTDTVIPEPCRTPGYMLYGPLD